MRPMVRSLNRREFLAMVAGAGAALAASSGAAGQPTTDTLVPRREFGRTGVKISQLCLGGGSFLGADSGPLLDEALKRGVDCWEIVSFSGTAYRDYFSAHPGVRERVFLTGKVRSTDPAVMQAQLDKLLADNGTTVIDFLAIHTIDDARLLTDEVRKWAEKARKEKKVRFFGFCTHRGMEGCLRAAANLDWIDGIQTVYNYRLQQIGTMEEALQRCHGKGIGIFAIKTMGLTVLRKAELQKLPLREETMRAALTAADLTFEQARLRAVWQNPGVSAICSMMPGTEILRANALAAIDPRPLSADLRRRLSDYADDTAQYFCRRCGACDAANTDQIPVFDIMEALMYLRGYGLKDLAAARFGQMPAEVRSRIGSSDYAAAEARCPQKMPIAELMKEAAAELGG